MSREEKGRFFSRWGSKLPGYPRKAEGTSSFAREEGGSEGKGRFDGGRCFERLKGKNVLPKEKNRKGKKLEGEWEEGLKRCISEKKGSSPLIGRRTTGGRRRSLFGPVGMHTLVIRKALAGSGTRGGSEQKKGLSILAWILGEGK